MSNLFRETLMKKGVISGSDLAEKMASPAVIFFFAGPRVYTPHAELWIRNDAGEWAVRLHEPRYLDMTIPSTRKKTVAAAQEDAGKALGVRDWAKSPFDNCWLPRSVLEAARARYMDATESPSTS